MGKVKKLLKNWVPSILIAVLLSFVLQTYVVQAVTIPSKSMVPTLNVNDKLIINKMIDPGDLERGDIVVFFSPKEDGKEERYIKRLMGVGGDTLEAVDGYYYRNGEKLEENYLAEPIQYEFGPVVVPEGYFFFLGDHRNISYDSHLWPSPFVAEDKVIGKAVFRYFPFYDVERM